MKMTTESKTFNAGIIMRRKASSGESKRRGPSSGQHHRAKGRAILYFAK